MNLGLIFASCVCSRVCVDARRGGFAIVHTPVHTSASALVLTRIAHAYAATTRTPPCLIRPPPAALMLIARGPLCIRALVARAVPTLTHCAYTHSLLCRHLRAYILTYCHTDCPMSPNIAVML